MNVLLLTVFIGLVFAAFFITLFLYQASNRRFSSNEREALMPLREERTRPAGKEKRTPGQ